MGDLVIELPTGESFRTTFNLAVKTDFLDRHRLEMTAMLQALKEAEVFIDQNPDRSKQIVTTWLKLDAKLVASLWKDYRFELFLDQSLIVTLEGQAQWFLDQKIITGNRMPNYLEFIDTKLLKAVSPTAMQVIE
jgi:ABC-type nitrate/sulfonate/bicarbonate transport system substrate-binding protein